MWAGEQAIANPATTLSFKGVEKSLAISTEYCYCESSQVCLRKCADLLTRICREVRKIHKRFYKKLETFSENGFCQIFLDIKFTSNSA